MALLGVLAPAMATAGPAPTEPFGFATAFKLDGSNGYSIFVYAYSERADGKGQIIFFVGRKGSAAFYSAPAEVTATAIRADLGSLGEVDVVFDPSGRQKKVRPKCGGRPEAYEPGTYVGALEFNGEEGYTRANQTEAPLLPLPLFQSGCGGSGSGEVTGFGLPGARLRGLSFAEGRTLSFQVNKNRPGARALFSASIRERHDGIRIDRAVGGTAPPNAFRFDPTLRVATLSPPAPFSGSASLRRGEDLFSPIWRGDLAIDFPGRSNVPLAGPRMHASIVHARFTRSNGPHAEIAF